MADGSDTESRPIGRPRKYGTPEELAPVIDRYFEDLPEGEFPTLSGLCYYLGFYDKESLTTYETYGDDFSRTVKSARLRIERDWAKALPSKDYSAAGLIFNLKCNHGYVETSRQEITGADGEAIRTTSTVNVNFIKPTE